MPPVLPPSPQEPSPSCHSSHTLRVVFIIAAVGALQRIVLQSLRSHHPSGVGPFKVRPDIDVIDDEVAEKVRVSPRPLPSRHHGQDEGDEDVDHGFGATPDFFTAEGYHRWVASWNRLHGFTNASNPRPLHILFEPMYKTEMVAAFPSMIQLASMPDVNVTLLSTQGILAVMDDGANPSARVIFDEGELQPGEQIETRPSLGIRESTLDVMQMAGVNVLRVKWSRRDSHSKVKEIQKGWIKSLQTSGAAPFDLVVTDCIPGPSAAIPLMRAGVPGIFWCGDFMVYKGGRLKRKADSITGAGVPKAKGKRGKIESAIKPTYRVFCTDFFGSENRGYSPAKAQILPGRKHSSIQFNTSFVSMNQSPLSNFTVTANRKEAADVIEDIKLDMRRLNKNILIYVSFGTQGFRFGRKAFELLFDQLGGVNGAYLYLVLPSIMDWHETDEWTVEDWKSKYWQAALPDHIRITKWAPQVELFQEFGYATEKTMSSAEDVDFIFFTHGGGNSLAESVQHSIPVICLPLLFDQPWNCHDIETAGIGKNMCKVSLQMYVDGLIKVPDQVLASGLEKEINGIKVCPKEASTESIQAAIGSLLQNKSETLEKLQTVKARADRGSVGQTEIGDMLYKAAQTLDMNSPTSLIPRFSAEN